MDLYEPSITVVLFLCCNALWLSSGYSESVRKKIANYFLTVNEKHPTIYIKKHVSRGGAKIWPTLASVYRCSLTLDEALGELCSVLNIYAY